MTKPILYYVYDPMCSWCWGYRPTWQALKKQLEPIVDIRYVLGGLAPECDEAMPDEMQDFLQQTWGKISRELGTKFNFDFWTLCKPRRSTYPACRAVLIAREYGKEQDMYLAIQQAYYLQAKNPSDHQTLTEIAADIGLEPTSFLQKLASQVFREKLADEVTAARQLPIQGFPSLVLDSKGRKIPVAIDYHHWQTSYDIIQKQLLS